MKPIDMKVVRVIFENTGHKQYAYYCPFDVKVGDKVIVDRPYNGYVAVEVVETGVILDKAAAKRVVCTIDDAEYKEWLAKEQRRKDLMDKLEKKRKAMEELAVFKILAKEDPEAAALLSELESL